MANTVNIDEIFGTLDQRKAEALEIIAKYSKADQLEASRIALLYCRCDTSSIKHICDTASILQRDTFKPL